jgi:hypothetical protein
MSGCRVGYGYILGIDERDKLQSGYLQVHRQDAARRAATGLPSARIDIFVGHVLDHVHVAGWRRDSTPLLKAELR